MLRVWLKDLSQPYPWLFVIIAVALVWLWLRSDARRRLLWVIIPFTMLWIFSMPLTSYLAIGSLEWGYPPLKKKDRPPDIKVIVVLSGGISYADAVRPQAILSEDTIYRCLHAAEIYKDYQQAHRDAPCKVLLSGGKVDASQEGPMLADVMKNLMMMLQVREQDILVEPASRTTYENAVESAKILKSLGINRVLLVTDAAHMGRAAACFRSQGIDVVPSGCRYRATAFPWSIGALVPEASGARGTQAALSEWLSRICYWILGTT